MNADSVARYLQQHPEFFEQHPDLLAVINVPNPHSGRAISLQERQLALLREKHRAIEIKLAEMVRRAQENDAIGDKLQTWTRQLLLAQDAQALAGAVIDGLKAVFSVPQAALRLWGVREAHQAMPEAAPVEVEAIRLANGMSRPYCGPRAHPQVARWLPDPPNARSMALLALRKGADPDAFGLIVLGSADIERFTSDMGTAYLERIAETSSAALSRLVE